MHCIKFETMWFQECFYAQYAHSTFLIMNIHSSKENTAKFKIISFNWLDIWTFKFMSTKKHFRRLKLSQGFYEVILWRHSSWSQTQVQKGLKNLDCVRQRHLITSYVPSCFLALLYCVFVLNFETEWLI